MTDEIKAGDKIAVILALRTTSSTVIHTVTRTTPTQLVVEFDNGALPLRIDRRTMRVLGRNGGHRVRLATASDLMQLRVRVAQRRIAKVKVTPENVSGVEWFIASVTAPKVAGAIGESK